jgi:gluconolactonase
MFPMSATPVRDMEVFTRLPDKFRKLQRNSWCDANKGGQEADSFLEGPVFDAEGNLYVTDIPFGRVFRIDAKGDWTLVVQYDGEPNGMKFRNDHELVITDYKNGLMVLDVRTAEVRPLLQRRNTERFKGVNDLFFDAAGSLYFTDQGQTGLHDPTGRVYRLSPSGHLDALLTNVPSPNGVLLSNDGKALFIAVTRGNCVWRGPLMDDGTVSKVGQFFTSYGPSGPDGLAMDEDGRLIVANPGLGVAWVLDHKAHPVEVLRSTAGASITNVAFGGPGRRTAYFTESMTGTVMKAQMPVAGTRLHRPK